MIALLLGLAAVSCGPGRGHAGLDPLPQSSTARPSPKEKAIADRVMAEQVLPYPDNLQPGWRFNGTRIEDSSQFAVVSPCVGGPPVANTAAIDADATYQVDPTGHEAGHLSMHVAVGRTPEAARSDFERVGRSPNYADCIATDVATHLKQTPGSTVVSQSSSSLDLGVHLANPFEEGAVRIISQYKIGSGPPMEVYTDDVDLLWGRIKVNVEFERCCSAGPWPANFEDNYISLVTGRMMAAERQ